MAKTLSPGDEGKIWLGRLMAGLKEKWDGLVIGEGSFAAWMRLGLKELRNAFNPSKESVADSEVGMYGSATQGEIADARRDDKGTVYEQGHSEGKAGPEDKSEAKSGGMKALNDVKLEPPKSDGKDDEKDDDLSDER